MFDQNGNQIFKDSDGMSDLIRHIVGQIKALEKLFPGFISRLKNHI